MDKKTAVKQAVSKSDTTKKASPESWESMEGAQLEPSGPILEPKKKDSGKFQGVNQSYTGKKVK